MSYQKMFTVWFLVLSLIAASFFFASFEKFFPGITHIGSFKTFDIEHDVFDVKAGNRACLVVSSKFKNEDNPRFFFSCPQER